MSKRRIWTEEEMRIIAAYSARGYPLGEIQEALADRGFTRSRDSIKSRRQRDSNCSPDADSRSHPEPTRTALEAITNMRDAATLGITRWIENHPQHKVTRACKVLSISDLHMPFFHEGVIRHAFDNHSDADILVINGDLFEMDMASRFPRHKTILLKYEYRIALEWLTRVAKQFKQVVLVEGNHEARISRYFQTRIDPGMNFIAEGDLLWRLSEGYGFDEAGQWEKKYDMSNVSYTRGLTKWFVQIGQTIFAHPWRTSSLSIRTVENAHKWFTDRNYSFQALVIGHTHRLGSHVTANTLLIEQGCMCVPLDYASRADINYRPTSFGYAVIIMDKHGFVDFNKSRPYFYGTGSTVPSHSSPVEFE